MAWTRRRLEVQAVLVRGGEQERGCVGEGEDEGEGGSWWCGSTRWKGRVEEGS